MTIKITDEVRIKAALGELLLITDHPALKAHRELADVVGAVGMYLCGAERFLQINSINLERSIQRYELEQRGNR